VRHVGFALASLSLLCVEADAYGHGRTVRLSQSDRPHEHRTVRIQVSDSLRCSSQGVLLGCLVELAPVPPDLLVFLSRAFRTIPSSDIFDMRRSPMMVFLSLSLSATSYQTKTFLHVVSIVLIGNGCVSTCIS
jgi:hypothetical protein